MSDSSIETCEEYDSDCLETFEDALESVGSSSDTTDSDDTEKLTKDFEVLQLSSQDESEKSQERESSSQSWQKCDADELQDDTSSPSSEEFSKESEPRDSPVAHCSRDEPIVSSNTPEKDQSDEPAKSGEQCDETSGAHRDVETAEKAPVERKTSAEWQSIVENYKSDRGMGRKLREVMQNLEKLRSKPTPEEISSDDEDPDHSDGLKLKILKRRNIKDVVIDMMNRQTVSRMTSSEEHSRLYRAFSVTMFLKTIGGERYTVEILSTVLDLVDSTTKTLWLEEETAAEKPTYGEFINFLYQRCQLADNQHFLHMGQAYQMQCYCCKLTHKMFHCQFFRSRGVGIRWKMSKENRLCSNCLQGRHPVRFCHSVNNCKICNKRHNTILHTSAEIKRKARQNKKQRKREALEAQNQQ